MANIFEIIEVPYSGEGHKPSVRIGISIHIGGQEGVCPLTGPLENQQALAREVGSMKEALDALFTKAKGLLPEAVMAQQPLDIRTNMTEEQIWLVLTEVPDEASFIWQFNNLDEDTRRAVAEHVLTRCNIFSGRASFFSSRYDQEAGLMA